MAKRKRKKNEEHIFDTEWLGLHVEAGGTEGGACLTRHESKVKPISCSHRYQGIQRAANEDRTYYNGVRPGWDISANDQDKNFRENARTPYVHQAHHIVTSGGLNSTILESAKSAGSTALYNLLRAGLLEAEYNVNHKTNMIILPMEARIAAILKLPVHTRPAKGDMFHAAYSALVQKEVQPVINDYAKLIQDSLKDKDHPPPPDKLAKAKLMRVSAKMRALIFSWGRGAAGKSLDGAAR